MRTQVLKDITPRSAYEIDFDLVPQVARDRFGRFLLKAVKKAFESPEVQRDFEEWKAKHKDELEEARDES